MGHWTDEYKSMIEDCGRRPKQLTDWEHLFLNSLLEQLDHKKHFHVNQANKIEEIWNRVTRGSPHLEGTKDIFGDDRAHGPVKRMTSDQLAAALESERPH